jgi:MYXO-CTERM domain-containing protein
VSARGVNAAATRPTTTAVDSGFEPARSVPPVAVALLALALLALLVGHRQHRQSN